ncbi:FHA domain-containing protein [Nocardia brevicatena]|uniref:FHA domain-containing protein n=1 Tax=Nocardia brevicatena TaxID=37327 RepID=UPI0002D75A25|nr:FHA domain-containing protein [Nocardia brevicatena]
MPREVYANLTGGQGRYPITLSRGGEAVLLGRGEDAVLPPGLAEDAVANGISERHAEMGAHPSGRLWIAPHGEALSPTYINGRELGLGEKVTLHPGDSVQLGEGSEFIVSYRPPEGGPLVELMDRTPETRQSLKQLAALQEHIYQRITEYMHEKNGGIVIGKQPVWQLRGLPKTEFTADGTPWKDIAGQYIGLERRIYVDSGMGSSFDYGDLVWHEFGHAADDAYGTNGKWLSSETEWKVPARGGYR